MQQFLVYSTSAACRVGEKYSYICYCIHLLCAHHPPPNKRNKCTSYRDLFISGFGKTRAWLLLPAQPGWLRLRMSLTSSPCFTSSSSLPYSSSLLLEEQWRSQELCPSCPSQHCQGSLMLRWLSTALAPGSREVVALAEPTAGGGEQPSHHLAAGGTPEAHRHTVGSESFVPAFPKEKQQPPGLTFPKLSSTGKKSWQFIKVFWRKWLCLMEAGCMDSAR